METERRVINPFRASIVNRGRPHATDTIYFYPLDPIRYVREGHVPA